MRSLCLKQVERLSCRIFNRFRYLGSSSSGNSHEIGQSSIDVSKVLEDHKQHMIKMPSIMDSETGIVNKWLIQEGENFEPDDTLCEATIDDMIIGMYRKHFLRFKTISLFI